MASLRRFRIGGGVLLLVLLGCLCWPRLLHAEGLSAEEFTRVAAQLQDGDMQARIAAAKRLGEAGDAKAAEALLAVLHADQAVLRVAVVEALGRLNAPQAKPALLAMLKDSEAEVRAAAAKVVGYYHDPVAVDALFAVLPDTHDTVRAAAAYGLGNTYEVRVLEPLRVLLEDDSPLVRIAAVDALRHLGQLQNWGNDVPLTWSLYLDDPKRLDAETREKMVTVLQRVGWDKTRDALAKLLDDKDHDVRNHAVLALQDLRDPRAVPYLAEAVKSADPYTRRDMIVGWTNTHDPQQIDLALAILKDETDVIVLRSLLFMLASTQNPRVLDPLIEAMPKKDPALRTNFLSALGWIKDPRACSTILPYLQDKDAAVRAMAAEALGQIANPQAAEPLVARLSDDDQQVRASALGALRSLLYIPATMPTYVECGQAVKAALAKDAGAGIKAMLKNLDNPSMREDIFNMLANCNEPSAAQALLTLSKGADTALREAALKTIWRMRGDLHQVALAGLLKDHDVDVRRHALTQLAQCMDTSTIPALIELLKDTDIGIRQSTVELLSKLHARSALPALRTALKDPDAGMRTAAAKAVLALNFRGQEDSFFPPVNDADNLEPFLILIKDADPGVRKMAISNLVSTTDPRTTEALLIALKDTEPEVRKQAARHLHATQTPRVVQTLLDALKDPDADVRAAMVQQLGWTQNPRFFAAAVQALQDANVTVRVSAVNALATFNDPRVVAICRPLLADKEASIRVAAVYALARRPGVNAVEMLLDMLKDAEPSVRVPAIQNLWYYDEPRAVKALITLFQGPQTVEVRRATMYAIENSDNPDFVPPLVTQLKAQLRDEDILPLAEIRDAQGGFGYAISRYDAVAALRNKTGALLRPALALLQEATPRSRAMGAALLVHTRDSRALPALTAALHDDQAAVRRVAARALRAQGDVRSLPPLIGALKDPDDAVRAEAALALGEVQDTRATAPLLALLQDKQANVQFAAATALGRIGDPAALAPLLACYQASTDTGLREAITSALANNTDPRVTALLLIVLKDGTPRQRATAITALGARKEVRAVPTLIEIAKLPWQAEVTQQTGDAKDAGNLRVQQFALLLPSVGPLDLQQRAMEALGAIGDPHAIEPLLEIVKANDTFKATAAEKALGHFRDERVVNALIARTALEGERSFFSAAIETLATGAVRDIAISAIITVLHDPSPDLRMRMVQVVLLMVNEHRTQTPTGETLVQPEKKDPRLVEPLLALLPGANGEFRREVCSILGKLGDKRASAPLLALLKTLDPETRRAAMYALQTLQDPGTIPALQTLLAGKDVELRKTAVTILSVLREKQVAPALAAALADQDAEVRREAAVGLCRLGDPRGLNLLLGLLKDPQYTAKGDTGQLISALASFPDDPRATDALLALLANARDNNRLDLLHALWKSHDPRAATALLTRAKQEMAFQTAGDGPPDCYSRTMDLLLSTLHGTDLYSPLDAGRLLPGHLADPRMLELCLSLLQATPRVHTSNVFSSYTDWRRPLRRNAIWLLGYSANPKAVQPLIAALEAGPLEERQEAALALGKLRDKRAIAPLTAALQHVGADARPAVEAALKAITGEK